MGDRVWCTLDVHPDHKEIAHKILEQCEFTPDYTDTNPEVCRFTFEEVIYGNLPDDVASALWDQCIPYDWDWERGGDFDSGGDYLRFTEQGESEFKTVFQDSRSIYIPDLLQRINDPKALVEFIHQQDVDTTVLPWENQVEYAKRASIARLIK